MAVINLNYTQRNEMTDDVTVLLAGQKIETFDKVGSAAQDVRQCMEQTETAALF